MTISNPSRLINQAFGNGAPSGNVNTIPDDDQTGTNPRGASFETGFPDLTLTPSISGGLPPDGADMNGILNILTDHIRHINSGGHYRFSSSLASLIGGYDKGCVLLADDGESAYVSAIDNNSINFNTTPSSIGVEWMPWAGGSIAAGAPTYTEDDKWELMPVGTCMPFISGVVGQNVDDFLTDHPNWSKLIDVTWLNVEHTRAGSTMKGRVFAQENVDAGNLAWNQVGSDNATLVSHTHTANDVSHTHTHKDTLLFESTTTKGGVPSGGGIELVSSASGFAGCGNTDTDNHYSYYRKTTTDSANLTINVGTAGSGNGTGANRQLTMYVNWIIKVN